MTRRQRATRDRTSSPTVRRLLDEAVSALDEDGFDRFNVQRVLDGSGVSRATLYRHFADVDGLIEAALGERYRREVDRYLDIAVGIIEEALDIADFRRSLRTMLQAFGAMPASVRVQRAHTIALASTRPGLAAVVASVQEALTQGWVSAFEEAQRRGFVRADLDTRAAAVVIQAVTLGRIVDDAGVSHLADDQWADALFEVLERSMLVPGD